MTRLIPNDLNTYPSYNLPVLAKLKNNDFSVVELGIIAAALNCSFDSVNLSVNLF